jgi:hypothetical protein
VCELAPFEKQKFNFKAIFDSASNYACGNQVRPVKDKWHGLSPSKAKAMPQTAKELL